MTRDPRPAEGGCPPPARPVGRAPPRVFRNMRRSRRRWAATPAPSWRRPRRGGGARTAGRVPARLSAGPARQAAIHVPGLRVAARGPADEAGGDGAVGLGLLRLRADLRVAFLRRPAVGRLRAVQFRDAGDRQAVRGHPRGGAPAGRPGQLRRDRGDEPLRADGVGRAAAAAAEGDRRRARSSASTCRASACRPMPRPRTCWPARCWTMPAPRPRPGPVPRPAPAARRTGPTVALLGEMFPADPMMIGAMLAPAGAGRRAGGAVPRVARALRRARLRRGGGDPSVLHRRRARVRGRGAAGRGLRPGRAGRDGGLAAGDRRRPSGCRRTRWRRRRTRSCRRSEAFAAGSDQGEDHAVGLRGLGAAGRAAADRERRGGAVCRDRLPEDALVRRPMRTGWRRGACGFSTAPRWSKTLRGWRDSRRTSPSGRRRWCRRRRSRASRRSTSPT